MSEPKKPAIPTPQQAAAKAAPASAGAALDKALATLAQAAQRSDGVAFSVKVSATPDEWAAIEQGVAKALRASQWHLESAAFVAGSKNRHLLHVAPVPHRSVR